MSPENIRRSILLSTASAIALLIVFILLASSLTEERDAQPPINDSEPVLESEQHETTAEDTVVPVLEARIIDEPTITIERSEPYTIEVDGRSLFVRSTYSTTLAVMDDAGISLLGHDFTEPGPTETLSAGQTITVHRVIEEVLTEDKPLPFETLWQGTETLEIDQRALLGTGKLGLLRQRTRILKSDGNVMTQLPVGEWLVEDAIDEVIGYGTNIVLRNVDTPEGQLEYWRVVRMWATSYTAESAGKPPDHPAYGITASGVQAGKGIIAVDPNIIPFRSKVYIPGYGIAFAGDTGGGVKGLIVDLGYDDGQLESWNRFVDVYYLSPVPSADQINYLLP
jgi:uncharacterized protein YabE (DUF348 family)